MTVYPLPALQSPSTQGPGSRPAFFRVWIQPLRRSLEADQPGGPAIQAICRWPRSSKCWVASRTFQLDLTPFAEFAAQDRNPFVCGEFVWTGIDYLGEPTSYDHDTTDPMTFTAPEVAAAKQKELAATGKIAVPSRSTYFGILDLAGFPKDRFYLYQARWRPDYPMAHILPHWTWPERIGQVTSVQVYTSGDEAELFLNGQSLGRNPARKYGHPQKRHPQITQITQTKVTRRHGGTRRPRREN
jgi:hypothetical protein